MQTNYVLRFNFNWEGNLTSWNVILTCPEGLYIAKCTSHALLGNKLLALLFPTTSPSVHSFDFLIYYFTFNKLCQVNNMKAKPKEREARSLSAAKTNWDQLK